MRGERRKKAVKRGGGERTPNIHNHSPYVLKSIVLPFLLGVNNDNDISKKDIQEVIQKLKEIKPRTKERKEESGEGKREGAESLRI